MSAPARSSVDDELLKKTCVVQGCPYGIVAAVLEINSSRAESIGLCRHRLYLYTHKFRTYNNRQKELAELLSAGRVIDREELHVNRVRV